MKIGPISTIVFKNSQPLRTDLDERKLAAADYVTLFEDLPDGTRKEIRMSKEEYQEYDKEQKRLKEEKLKQEQIKLQQEWIALINRPGKYNK